MNTNLNTSSSLKFNDIGMIFPDGTEALRNISFELSKGEFVTIVGPSGCGKSTLLKIASGLLEPTNGSVEVDRERLGYVFQDATLLPWRTVSKNVELLAELHGTDSHERKRLVEESIELVGLEGFENHYPKSLSGGMKMRCSLARSLTLKPPVFLFDEPFGKLDPAMQLGLLEEYKMDITYVYCDTEDAIIAYKQVFLFDNAGKHVGVQAEEYVRCDNMVGHFLNEFEKDFGLHPEFINHK